MASCCSLGVKHPGGGRGRPKKPVVHFDSHGGLTRGRPPADNISSALNIRTNSVTKEDLKKLLLQTTSRHFLERSSVADEGTKADNLHGVYNYGKKGKSQRRDYSCLWGVPDKSYSRDFDGRPSVDFHANAEMAQSCRPGPSPKVPDTGEEMASTYMGLHRGPSVEDMRKARPNTVPVTDAERLLGGIGISLETKSSSHKQHSLPLRGGRGEQGKMSENFLPQHLKVHRGLDSTYRSEVGPRREGGHLAAPLTHETKVLSRSKSTPTCGGANVKMPHMYSLTSAW